MTNDPRDPYERFDDASTTPFLDLIVNVVLMASVAGGSLAVLLTIGYLAQPVGRSRAWPFIALIAALGVVNLLVRAIRSHYR